MTRCSPRFLLAALGLVVACGDDVSPDHDAAVAFDASPGDAAPGGDAAAGDAAADGADVDAGPALTSLVLDGAVVPIGGADVPATAQIIVVWFAQNDALYKFGEGTSTEATYHVSLATVPPNEALLGGALGVGLLALLPADFELPADGIVDGKALEASAIGLSWQHAVVYVVDPLAEGWPASFPVGYACGVCVPGVDAFDAWAPTSCAEVEIQTGDLAEIPFCNWT